jgi:hypothetical protein
MNSRVLASLLLLKLLFLVETLDVNNQATDLSATLERRINVMANKMDANQTNSVERKLAYGETQPRRNDIKEQRGGPQTNQVMGETDKGAHNQDTKGRNPQGNKSD